MSDLVVLGGRQRSRTGLRELGDDWYGYGAGVVLRVRDGQVSTVGEYRSAPGTHAEDDAILLKSATVVPGRIHACTQTEILDFVDDGLTVERHVSLPFFNDVHHVLPTEHDTRLVAVSGCELVAEVADDGEVVDAWSTLDGQDPWDRIRTEVDLRQGVNLKPHRSHPNYLFVADGHRWATRFEQRDALDLDDGRRTIQIGSERIHDGVVHKGLVHFTTVDGFVVAADPVTGAVVSRHDLSTGIRPEEAIGWTRSLCFDGDHCWVGFSRIRFTKVRQRLSFIRTGQRSRPTRIVKYRTADWVPVESIDLEPFGCNAVFTIGHYPF